MVIPGTFGIHLRIARTRNKITLRDAAKILKMDVGNLSRLERSILSPPSKAKEIRRICTCLKIAKAVEDLLVDLAFQDHLAALRGRFWE